MWTYLMQIRLLHKSNDMLMLCWSGFIRYFLFVNFWFIVLLIKILNPYFLLLSLGLWRIYGETAPQHKSRGLYSQPCQNLQDWEEACSGWTEPGLLSESDYIISWPQWSWKNNHNVSNVINFPSIFSTFDSVYIFFFYFQR